MEYNEEIATKALNQLKITKYRQFFKAFLKLFIQLYKAEIEGDTIQCDCNHFKLVNYALKCVKCGKLKRSCSEVEFSMYKPIIDGRKEMDK